MIYIIGIGVDGDKTLTNIAAKYIENADIIIGAKRICESVSHLSGYANKDVLITYKTDEIVSYIENNSDKSIAVLMSGDCGFYSGCSKLRDRLADKYDVEVVSGISSLVYFCNEIGTSWQDANIVSLHGTNANICVEVANNYKTFFLLGGEKSAADVCNILCEYSLGDAYVYVGENLAGSNQRLHSGKAHELTSLETDNLAVMLVLNNNYNNLLMTGIDDELFTRGNVPMTKSELRAVVISKLRIKRDDVCVDIGCGTGSVSVEMAIQAFKGSVYAIDKNSEAIELTRANAKKFSCDNITTINMDIKDGLDKVPAPDVVFVGGSSGCFDEIFSYVNDKNKACRVIVTAVSLETINAAINAFEQNNRDYFVTQIAVTRTRRLGSHTMLNSENPIFIIGDK